MHVGISGGLIIKSGAGCYVPDPSAIPNRMGGLISAGGGGSYSSENHPHFKNRFREGYFVAGATLDASGWPTNAHGVILSGASVLASWTSGTFKCGYIGAGTPTALNNATLSNIVNGNGTSTYTTFDLIATNANFGFNVSAAANSHFAYLPAYPAAVVDDPTNPNSITGEAATLYSQMHHLRTEWHGVALWNSQLMTQANRNTPSNTQTFHQTNQWFANQTATLGGLPALGATSSTLSGWTRGAGTWLLVFNESGSFEGRICTVGAGANPTLTWTGGLTAAASSTSVTYGTEGYPIEWMFALAVAANTSLVICEPTLQDGTNGVAGTYTAGTLAIAQTYITNYPAWTGKVYFTPGNENWNPTYNSYRVFVESARLGGYSSRVTYAGSWMHALANLGRTQFPSLWGTRVGAVLEWQDQNPDQFYGTYDYMVNTLAVTPSADILYQSSAPYMNPAGLVAGSTVAQIIAAVAAKAATQPATSLLENTVIMGLHYGIPHMTYESGPQWNSGIYTGITNLPAAIMDPTYSAPIETYYNNLANSGVQLFTHNTLGVPPDLSGGGGGANELGNIFPVTRANTPNWEALMTVALSLPALTRNLINGAGAIILGGNYADKSGAANPGFPSGTFSNTQGSPYHVLQGYVGWYFNCTVAQTYAFVLTCTGSGTPQTNVELGGLGGFTIPITNFTLAVGLNNVGNLTIPVGPGYILLGKGTPQSTLLMSQLQFN